MEGSTISSQNKISKRYRDCNMIQEIEENLFAEYCHVHSNIYGTHKKTLNSCIERGIICILDIDLQGGQKINKNFETKCNYLFIDAPSFEEL